MLSDQLKGNIVVLMVSDTKLMIVFPMEILSKMGLVQHID